MTSRSSPIANEFSFPQNTIRSVIENFLYTPEKDVTFTSYFRRYEGLYTTDCANWNNSKKVRLLLRKLGTTELTKFINYTLPRKANELTFAETVELLMELFSPKTCLFHKRWRWKKEEDYTTFESEVNKHCDDFRLAELSADIFKCLIFVQEQLSKKAAKIRWRILNKLENEPNNTLQQKAEDCQRYVSMNQDSEKKKRIRYCSRQKNTLQKEINKISH